MPAQLLGRDPDNDLAVIKIDPSATDQNGRTIADRIKPVTLGDSDQVTIGETAIAIGISTGEDRAQRAAFQRGVQALVADGKAAIWQIHAWPA